MSRISIVVQMVFAALVGLFFPAVLFNLGVYAGAISSSANIESGSSIATYFFAGSLWALILALALAVGGLFVTDKPHIIKGLLWLPAYGTASYAVLAYLFVF